MLGLSFHTSASGVTVVTFMASCASAELASAIKAPKNRTLWTQLESIAAPRSA